jgi:hypothetical protein
MIWTDIVENYSKRSLNFLSDRLPAVSGIASHFKQLLPNDKYMFDLWKSTLDYGLLWSTTCDNDHENKSRPSWHHVPSWSRESVDGPVKWASFDERTPILAH